MSRPRAPASTATWDARARWIRPIPRMPSHAAGTAAGTARDGHTTESRAEVDLASSAEEFHLTIDLAIDIDGAEPVTRRWDERIPRVLL